MYELARAAYDLANTGLAASTKIAYNCKLQMIANLHPGFIPMDSPAKVQMFFATLKGAKWSAVGSTHTCNPRTRGWHHHSILHAHSQFSVRVACR